MKISSHFKYKFFLVNEVIYKSITFIMCTFQALCNSIYRIIFINEHFLPWRLYLQKEEKIDS